MPFCGKCGAENPENTKFCGKCGALLETGVEVKKKTSKMRWILYFFGAIIVLGVIGNMLPDTSDSVGSSSEASLNYKWVEVWSGEYSHNVFDLYYDNDLEIFEIPSNAVHLKVDIEFWDGDKDSYIRVKLYRWGETDDIMIDSYYKDDKQGSGVMEKVNPRGTKYYINLSAISGLEFKFTVFAKVPE